MSIYAYVGLPGSGKSYDTVANQILPALDDNRRVVTNIPLNRDEVRKHHLKGEIVELPLDVVAQQPERIEEYATPGCVLIIDEAWRLWPCGTKADKVPQPFKSLLAEHRHKLDSQGRAMQIVLVTQDLAQLAAFARQLVEQTFHHTKLGTVGLRAGYRIDVFHGAVTGAVPPVNNRIREIFGKYSPKIFKMYQSHTFSEAKGKAVDERAMDKRGSFWRRPVVWVSLAATVAAVWWSVGAISSLASEYVGSAESGVAAAADPQTRPESFSSGLVERARTPAPVVQKPAPPPYRLAGWVQNDAHEDGGKAIISDGKRDVVIGFNQCRFAQEGDARCRYEGHWVGAFGISQ